MGCGKHREATTSIHPNKTANLVPEFAVEDLPLNRSAALMLELAVKDLPLGRTLMIMMTIYSIIQLMLYFICYYLFVLEYSIL